jgi:hypothetical protein
MEQKVCKNKKCRKPLPDGYRYKYCESCRNGQVKRVKDLGKATLGLVLLLATAAAGTNKEKDNLEE